MRMVVHAAYVLLMCCVCAAYWLRMACVWAAQAAYWLRIGCVCDAQNGCILAAVTHTRTHGRKHGQTGHSQQPYKMKDPPTSDMGIPYPKSVRAHFLRATAQFRRRARRISFPMKGTGYSLNAPQYGFSLFAFLTIVFLSFSIIISMSLIIIIIYSIFLIFFCISSIKFNN